VVRDDNGNEVSPAEIHARPTGEPVMKFKPRKAGKHFADFSENGTPIGNPVKIEVVPAASTALLPTDGVIAPGRLCSFPVAVTGIEPYAFHAEPEKKAVVGAKTLVDVPLANLGIDPEKIADLVTNDKDGETRCDFTKHSWEITQTN